MTFDHKQALKFLETLTGKAKPEITFQIFGDKKENRFLPYHCHGRLPGEMYQKLKHSNGQGAGVFAMINEGDGKGRRAENVTKIRALFLDLDGAPMEPARDALKPHIVVESSPSKYHIYWKVYDCPLERFTALQRAIALQFGGDASVCDLSRVMRLPGFYHQKGDPVMTRLVKADDFPPYSVAEVIQGLGLDIVSSTVAPAEEKPEPLTVIAGTSQFEALDTSTGEVVDLHAWAVRHPDFKIASALREYAPQVVQGPSRGEKQHIVCPFEEEHTETGGSGTYVVDGTAAKGTKGFVIHCCHAHCADRDRLLFVREMLVKGWLPLDALTDPRFLADMRRPPKVYYPGAEYQKHPGFLQLSQAQKGQFLNLFMHIGMFIEAGATVPDTPRTICRYLGIGEPEWIELRGLFLEVGLCHMDTGRLVADLMADEDASAFKAYNASIRRSRGGGAKTQQNKHLP